MVLFTSLDLESLDGWDKMTLEGITRFTLPYNKADEPRDEIYSLIQKLGLPVFPLPTSGPTTLWARGPKGEIVYQEIGPTNIKEYLQRALG